MGAPRPPGPTTAYTPSALELFRRNVKDIYFDYDSYDLRPADAIVLKADADFLAAHPSYRITISGHCDERGPAITTWRSERAAPMEFARSCKGSELVPAA